MANEALSRFNKMYAIAIKMLPASQPISNTDSVNAHKVRMAIVYGVAAMDSYFTQKFLNYLTRYLRKMGEHVERKSTNNQKETDEKLEKLLSDSGITPVSYRNMFENKKPYRVIHSLVRSHLQSRWTTQRFGRIDDLFRIYGIGNISEPALDKTKKNIKLKGGVHIGKRIKALVERRNKIVHECDMNSEQELGGLDIKRVKKDLAILKEFVEAADEVIVEKLKL